MAQQNLTLYHMHNIPQSNFLNPAVQGRCKVWVGMPALSSIHLDIGNTFTSFNSASQKVDSSFKANIDNFTRKMHKIDFITSELHINLIAIGYRYRSYYFTFTITEKNNFIFSFPRTYFTFPLEGNEPEIGETIKMNRFGVNFMHYREYALGISKIMDDNLTLGVKGKLLFGKANVNTRKSQIELYTHERTYDWDIHTSMRVNGSAPVTLSTDAMGIITDVELNDPLDVKGLILNRKNYGFAVDGGLLYKYSDRMLFSASFLDLGFIRWRSDVHNVTEDYDYLYQGVDMHTTNLNLFDYARGLLDTIINNFEFETSNKKYITPLPLKIYLGGTYNLNNKLNMGLLHGYRIYKWRFIPSLTLSANSRLTKGIAASASWSYYNYTLNNLGLGLSFESRNFQYYIVSDNVSGLIWWQTMRGVNLRFGFNFFFKCRELENEEAAEDICVRCPGCSWIVNENKKTDQRNRFLIGKKKNKKKKKRK